MRLTELATVVDGQLKVVWNSHLECWQADITNCEIKGDGVLSSCWGSGDGPNEALRDLAKNLSGQRIVFDAGSATRREFSVPKDIYGA